MILMMISLFLQINQAMHGIDPDRVSWSISFQGCQTYDRYIGHNKSKFEYWNFFVNNVEIMETLKFYDDELMFFKLKNQISSKIFFESKNFPEITTGVFKKNKKTHHQVKFFIIPTYATLALEYKCTQYHLLDTLPGHNAVRYCSELESKSLKIRFRSGNLSNLRMENFWIARFEDETFAEKNGVKFIGSHYRYANVKTFLFLSQYLLRKKLKYLPFSKANTSSICNIRSSSKMLKNQLSKRKKSNVKSCCYIF